MTKTIVIEAEENTEEISEAVENVEEIAEEIKSDNSETVEAVEEIVEDHAEEIEGKVKSWLESAIQPIAETLTTLTTGLLSLAERQTKMETEIQASLIPQVSNTETTLNETETGNLSTEPVESPVESAEESLVETMQEMQVEVEVPLNRALREIHKI